MLIPSKAEMLAGSFPLWGSQGATAFSLESYRGTLPVWLAWAQWDTIAHKFLLG